MLSIIYATKSFIFKMHGKSYIDDYDGLVLKRTWIILSNFASSSIYFGHVFYFKKHKFFIKN
jgi:hypothetical protein